MKRARTGEDARSKSDRRSTRLVGLRQGVSYATATGSRPSAPQAHDNLARGAGSGSGISPVGY